MSTAIVWFRQDLRLADNPALRAATAAARHVVPVYVWSPEEEGAWAPGAAARWWLHESLRSLESRLRQRESRLLITRGPTLDALLLSSASPGPRAPRRSSGIGATNPQPWPWKNCLNRALPPKA